MRYTPESLMRLANSVLAVLGCNEEESQIVADHLVQANLTGHDSHGIGMLPTYALQVFDGNMVPNQTPTLAPPVGAISVVDAHLGFGHRMALLGLDHAMQSIDEHRVAILALRNSGHVSRVGTYSEYCAKQGYVSIHFANVAGHSPMVSPFGAAQAGFSTNPISMAMPVETTAKPLLDIATSTVAFGKVRVANNKGEQMPQGCLLDEQGLATTDPAPLAEERRGSLAAFGQHKGSGLGIFVELLAGALAGTHTAATQPHLPNGVINNMLSIIIDPAAFDEPSAVQTRTEQFYDFIKACRPATGVDEVLMPGEPENHARRERLEKGIFVDAQTLRQIEETLALFPDMDKQACKGIIDQLVPVA